MVELQAHAFAQFYELGLLEGLTRLEVVAELLALAIHEDVGDLEQLLFEYDWLVLGKDIENVAIDDQLLDTSLRQDAHDLDERVPLEVVLKNTKINVEDQFCSKRTG